MAQPLGFAGLFGMTLFGCLLVASLPWIGPLLVLGLMPSLWVAFMSASLRASTAQRFGPQVLFEAWRKQPQLRAEQIKLGVLYALSTLAVMLAANWLGPGTDAWQQLLSESSDPSSPASRETALLAADLWTDLLLRLGLSLPVTLAFWHAPALIHWAGHSAGKALFASWLACWHNRGAFVVYGIAWGCVAGLILSGMGLVALLLGTPQAAQVFMLPLVLVMGAAFYASLFATVSDCFEQKPAPRDAE